MVELEADVEALEEEVERLSGPAAEAAEAKEALEGARAEAHAVLGQVRGRHLYTLNTKTPKKQLLLKPHIAAMHGLIGNLHPGLRDAHAAGADSAAGTAVTQACNRRSQGMSGLQWWCVPCPVRPATGGMPDACPAFRVPSAVRAVTHKGFY